MATYCKSLTAVMGDRRDQLQANIVVRGWTRAIPYVALKTANMQVIIIAILHRNAPQQNAVSCWYFTLFEKGTTMIIVFRVQ